MASEVMKRLINVEEYYKMADVGILKPEDRVELINGEIYQMSPIGSRHAATVDHLAMMLNQLFERKVIVRVQNPVRINSNNEPEPDISLLSYRSDFYAAAHPGPAEVLTVIEVAGFSIRFDREVKTPLYASCGIEEYWIIDIDHNWIEVFTNPKDGIYTKTQIYRPDDKVILLDKKLSVKELILLV